MSEEKQLSENENLAEGQEKTEGKKGKSRNKKWWYTAAAAVLIGSGIGAYFLLSGKGEVKATQAGIMDVNGQLEASGNREEELKRIMDESMVAVSINSAPYFENGHAAGNLQIENLAFNRRLIQVEIYLNNDLEKGVKDKPIYKMDKLMPPNAHIKEDKLSMALSKGKYPATAYFITYDVEDPSKYLGQASVGMEITVGN